MTPTPRTDAIAHRGLSSVAYIAEMTDFARQLEAELAAERALADRLADHLDTALGAFDYQEAPHVVRANRALAAWKEARHGTV